MHNDKHTLGLLPSGEPSETLVRLDKMVRALTAYEYGVRDVVRCLGELHVTVLDVGKAKREEPDAVRTVIMEEPDGFALLRPETQAAAVARNLANTALRGVHNFVDSIEPTRATDDAAAPDGTSPASRGLYEILGVESFRLMRRHLRADWMSKHGLSEAPPAAHWIGAVERFWFRALGLPMPQNAYEPPLLEGCLAPNGIKPDDVRRSEAAVADATFCLVRDHAEVFARDGRECVYVAQPYFNDNVGTLTSHIRSWRERAEKYGLGLEVSLKHSWYYPGRSVLLALWLPPKP